VKRHEALARLSRDHHQALFQAVRMRRATEEDAAEVLENFLDYWNDVGNLHFRAEEEVLLPAYSAHADARQEAVVRVLVDHVELRRAAHELGETRGGAVSPDLLRAAGDKLEAHVRHEERVLFPLIEDALSDEELVRVARGVDEVERAA